jgi:hypothetical protein
MATIVTRSGKGSPLTHAEVDSNFTNLNTDKLELSGGTMTGNLSFGDNTKAIFGAGSDLQIYHNGSDSFIDDAGTGNLNIRGSSIVQIGKYTGEVAAQFVADGEVNLRYNNSEKLATTSTGVDITGTLTSDGLTLDAGVYKINNTSIGAGTDKWIGSDGGAGVFVNAGSSGNFNVYNNNSIGRLNVNGSTGDISFYEDTGTTAKFFWDASAERLGLGSTSPSASLHLPASSASTYANGIFIGAGTGDLYGLSLWHNTSSNTTSYIDNRYDNASAATKIRMRTQGTPVDAMTILGSGNVGIGTTSPNYDLTVGTAGTTANSYIQIGSTTTGTGNLFFGDTTGTGAGSYSGFLQYNHNVDAMIFGTSGGTERMRIDSSGRILIGQSASTGSTNADELVVGSGSGNQGITIFSGTSNGGTLAFKDSGANEDGFISYNHGSQFMQFGTGSSERMRIDSSGRVGIGTSSPSYAIHTKSSSGGVGLIESTSANSDLYFKDSGTTYNYSNGIGSVGDALRFRSGDGTERMRIDSSGNLLVGTTSVPATSNTNGFRVDESGYISLTGAGTAAIDANRSSSDGIIINLRKDGTTVGSIKSDSGKLVVNSEGSNLVFAVGGTNEANIDGTQFYPQTDGGLDLGHPSVRWKDLRLSGGVYLGGTGSANKLDDYEEGTWTPAVGGATTDPTVTYTSGGQTGYYTKIGRMVHIQMFLNCSAISGGSGAAKITGIPFDTDAAINSFGAVQVEILGLNMASDRNNVVLRFNPNYGHFRLEFIDNRASSSGGGGTGISVGDLANNFRVLGSFTYMTDA